MTLSENRLYDQIRFYEILDMLAPLCQDRGPLDGTRMLAECTGRVL
jgi:hypothetical protein